MIAASYDSLCIEVTRRCNMHCAHCLRGEACNVDIDSSYIERFMDHVHNITSLTFTGGEPSLNVKAMEDTLRICKEKQIPVGSFYVVTNGKKVTNRFMKALMDWAIYCLENDPDALEYCGVCVSKDMFHEKVNDQNVLKLKTLSFFNEDKTADFRDYSLINLGRAKNLHIPGVQHRIKNRYPISVEVEDSFGIDENDQNFRIESTVTLTATGAIMPDCDYAYEEEDDLSVGNVTSEENLEGFIKYLIDQSKASN